MIDRPNFYSLIKIGDHASMAIHQLSQIDHKEKKMFGDKHTMIPMKRYLTLQE